MDIGYFQSSNLPKTSIFIKGSTGNKHSRLANHSQIIFCTFWLVSQSKTLIYVCEKSIHSEYRILISDPIKPQYRGLVN